MATYWPAVVNFVIAQRISFFIANAMTVISLSCFVSFGFGTFRWVRTVRTPGADSAAFASIAVIVALAIVAHDRPRRSALRHFEFDRILRGTGDFQSSINAISRRAHDVGIRHSSAH